MFKKTKILKILLVLSILSACSFDNEENTVAFIGDSLIARWDLQEYFPSLKTENYGLSGSGISYLENYKDVFYECDVVIITGTNDLNRIERAKEPEYAASYSATIKKIKATNVYLFSIFPRSFKNDPDSINYKIARINKLIKEHIDSTNIHYINVYDYLLKDNSINMFYSYDGLHLSPYGYELISSLLRDMLQ